MVPATLLVPRVLHVPPPKEYAEELLARLKKIWSSVQEAQTKTNERTKRYEDRFRGLLCFKLGDEVLCKRFQLQLRGEDKRKQEFQYDGPFSIKRMIKPSVAELEGLPEGAPKNINVQYLRKYLRFPESDKYRSLCPPPPAITVDDDTEWEVERIEEHRGVGQRREFLVKWKGYPKATWTKEGNLTNCDKVLKEYWQRQSRCR